MPYRKILPPPTYTTLNPTPRNPRHGQHRRPSPTTHSDPADGAGDSAGRPSPIITKPVYTFFSKYPKPIPIPYAGVRTGELISHRLWRITDDNTLCSIAHFQEWVPGEVMSGNVNEEVGDGSFVFGLAPLFGGVYSFFTEEQCLEEIPGDIPIHHFPFRHTKGWPTTADIFTIHGIAMGTIKSWGEVVEHEHGYRSQFAKAVSIDRVWGLVDIDTLRRKYLP